MKGGDDGIMRKRAKEYKKGARRYGYLLQQCML